MKYGTFATFDRKPYTKKRIRISDRNPLTWIKLLVSLAFLIAHFLNSASSLNILVKNPLMHMFM